MTRHCPAQDCTFTYPPTYNGRRTYLNHLDDSPDVPHMIDLTVDQYTDAPLLKALKDASEAALGPDTEVLL